jgi:glycosyltransferase involved in cell wall biosynthesis
MNILFVDEKNWVKKVPYTIHYLAEYMADRGHNIIAIDFDDSWTKVSIFDFISHRTRKKISKFGTNNYIDVISPLFIKIPLVSRISTLLTHFWEIRKILHYESIDSIIIYSVTNAIPALLLARLYNVPLLFHSIDMLDQLAPHPFLGKMALLIERLLIRHSDCVLALTPIFAARATQIGARDVAVIPNGVNVQLLRPDIDSAQLRNEFSLFDEKIILFVGTLTKHLALDQFLFYFSQMPRDGIKLVVVGDDITSAGREMQKAKEMCRVQKIENSVVFVGMQPTQRVPLFINLADVCVSPFPPSTFSKYNIAMKIFEYMACGKPTVSFKLAGTLSLVPPLSGGVVYVESYEEMCAAISSLLQNEIECTRLGDAGRQLVNQKFSWESVAGELENTLTETRKLKIDRHS